MYYTKTTTTTIQKPFMLRLKFVIRVLLMINGFIII